MSCLAISPDGSLCASGGKDGTAMLWDLNESKWLYTLETAVSGGASAPINALCFSPNRYWLCAATGSSVKIWVLHATLEYSTALHVLPYISLPATC